MAGGNMFHESVDGPAVPGLTILKVLGRGGSAVVYLARQDELDRLVALKVIRRPIEDPKVWRDFDREVKAVARLSGHSHVVTIYTTGRTATGFPFLVTEYADRGSLADVLASHGPLPVVEAAVVAVGVADALAAAHAVGIIHRDVKPGNVLLTTNAGVKLADFGIARLLSAPSVTTTGTIAFTPEHVAPEVLRGEAAREPADVYGLASMTVNALTGSPPFGTTATGEPIEAVLTRKLTTHAVDLPASVPPRLRAALTTALSADPGRRPLLHELRRALAEATVEPVTALPGVGSVTARQPAGAVTARQPALDVVAGVRRSRRRRRVLGTVLVGAALTMLLAGAVFALTRRDGRSTAATSAPTTAAATTTVGPTTAASATTAAPARATPTTAAPVTATPTTAKPVAAPDRARMAETFLRSYYSAVAARDYQTAWSMLTPEFQANTAGGYHDYTAFWDTVDGVEVRRVDVQPGRDGNPWPVVANLTMRYTRSGRVVDEVDQLTLAPDATGAPLIAGYQAGHG
jgi:hypothetical protein